jgi:hypothetical protein
MIDPKNAWMQFLVVVVATALTVRFVLLLIAPVLPEIAIVIVAVAICRLVRWRRERW